MMRLKKSVKIRKEGEDTILLFDIETELLCRTNSFGYEIIKLLDGRHEKEEIIKILTSKFHDVEEERIRNDVENFLKTLELKNFVEIIPIKIIEGLYLFRSEIGSFTYYIDDEKKVLIDAGVFVKKPIDIIVITHCHFDHILFLNELKKINNCKVICGEKEREAIESLNEKVLVERSPKKLHPTKIDKVVKEGDIINCGRFKLRVLETPGHTDGSISLFEEKHKVLFSGDAWFGGNYQGRWIYPSGSEIESKKTLEKLKGLNPKILCPGHWNVVFF